MPAYEKILILTGAGLSAESGVSTFRDPDGIWSKYNIEDVATPEAFARQPDVVQDFYNNRRRGLLGVKPNAAHEALARLQAKYPAPVIIVTQNIDNLHEAGGADDVIHMHGELHQSLCANCGARKPCDHDLGLDDHCASCGHTGSLRPDVVWFGEMPYQMDEIYEHLSSADLFISIGTSGNVYPAAGFVAGARGAGAHTVELNLEPSEGVSYFADAIHGPATQVVPAYVDKLLSDL
ncbi:MAG: NAD-dependent deacylase [Pseudomonadota bacterium]